MSADSDLVPDPLPEAAPAPAQEPAVIPAIYYDGTSSRKRQVTLRPGDCARHRREWRGGRDLALCRDPARRWRAQRSAELRFGAAAGAARNRRQGAAERVLGVLPCARCGSSFEADRKGRGLVARGGLLDRAGDPVRHSAAGRPAGADGALCGREADRRGGRPSGEGDPRRTASASAGKGRRRSRRWSTRSGSPAA